VGSSPEDDVSIVLKLKATEERRHDQSCLLPQGNNNKILTWIRVPVGMVFVGGRQTLLKNGAKIKIICFGEETAGTKEIITQCVLGLSRGEYESCTSETKHDRRTSERSIVLPRCCAARIKWEYSMDHTFSYLPYLRTEGQISTLLPKQILSFDFMKTTNVR
jgi:hypothetical protein